ncbi:MAG TPA: hypothetical protein DCG19_12300 [Cryomorphaceae bacterium]|nr:hypothetical protein [Owenweeksia sp.]MBF99195.1 hypothetical protein [Owenweeksia sp.]HAD98182.1 hypothetical protein [Cryomorphaceae bacterium]HBF22009.1 hypothetical protein [Cryomorphaceae bacterium]HCQ16492.1 hypothetical protein [Cryomorphaceae bacterium]|tara:strand:+ start:3887 stop:4183 length:297 start_codon:yes stop_codon:yes gene_type:complete
MPWINNRNKPILITFALVGTGYFIGAIYLLVNGMVGVGANLRHLQAVGITPAFYLIMAAAFYTISYYLYKNPKTLEQQDHKTKKLSRRKRRKTKNPNS